MNDREKALRKRLLVTFREEAQEHIGLLSQYLMDLEKADAASSAKIVEEVFREAHSLKGAARAVSLKSIESICSEMESVFASMKRGELAVSPPLVDLLLRATKTLELLKEPTEDEAEAPGVSISPLLKALAEARKGVFSTLPAIAEPKPASAVAAPAAEPVAVAPAAAVPKAAPAPAPAPHPSPAEEVVRVHTSKLDAVRLQSEELLAEKLTAMQLAADLQQIHGHFAEWNKQWTKARGDLRALMRARDREEQSGTNPKAELALAQLAEFFEWNSGFIEAIDHKLGALSQAARSNGRSLAGKAEALADDSRGLLMLPCTWLLETLRQTVRDLARSLDKPVELRVDGADFEVDRRVLSELRVPILHVLRNCVDHGIESRDVRARSGKAPVATITIAIKPAHGNRVEIRISDDGGGIDARKVKASAIRLGVLDELLAPGLTDEEALGLIFRSEVTTSPSVTDVSGRGLGLAIVREKIENLGGTVRVESRQEVGTTFCFDIPMSLATFRGVVVKTGGQFFVLSTGHIERLVRVGVTDVRISDNSELVLVGEEPVGLMRMSDVVGLPSNQIHLPAGGRTTGVVICAGGWRSVFLVDEVWQEQEVLVKTLGPHLRGLQGVTGATILPNGKIAPILDGAWLLRRASDLAKNGGSLPITPDAKFHRKRSILIAEDSITSRTLLKSILEAANFEVQTAVDGLDAFGKLTNGKFDLLVSDVDMPRLNGLGLAARVRADEKLSRLPVVLVTSLESAEDRERGRQAGADAYLVKRSFEQSDLLEAINRLL